MHEHFFQCPHCWEEISMLLDLSQISVTYIEDCEVCCNPMQIRYTAEHQELVVFEVVSIDQ